MTLSIRRFHWGVGILGSQLTGCEWRDIVGKTGQRHGSVEGSAVHTGKGRRDVPGMKRIVF